MQSAAVEVTATASVMSRNTVIKAEREIAAGIEPLGRPSTHTTSTATGTTPSTPNQTWREP